MKLGDHQMIHIVCCVISMLVMEELVWTVGDSKVIMKRKQCDICAGTYTHTRLIKVGSYSSKEYPKVFARVCNVCKRYKFFKYRNQYWHEDDMNEVGDIRNTAFGSKEEMERVSQKWKYGKVGKWRGWFKNV